MTIEAVIFDWGGTLTTHHVTVDDMLGNWRRAADVLAPDSSSVLADALFDADKRLWDEARGHRRSFRLRDVVGRGIEQFGQAGGEVSGDVDEACEAYLAAWAARIRHDSDAAEVLAALRERGMRTGLLSNTFWPAAFHDDLLRRDELRDLFTECCYSCDLPNLKPHAGAFRAALSAVGVDDPARAVFVGDRADDDIAGAQAMGMRAVWRPNHSDPFRPPDPLRAPDAVIDGLGELLAVVDTWR